mgnify:CR=1 FL=1
MLKASFGFKGGITAPQRTAALAGYDILRDGGTAIEAIIAAAATVAVTYPHMNGIGGDAFWLIKKEGKKPIAISGCGYSGSKASIEWYEERGFTDKIPTRGGLACLTVPGAVSSWEKALSYLKDPDYKLIILDEIIVAIKLGYISEDEIIKGIQLRPELTHVALTGRGASKRLMDSADLVTEMKLIHHPFREQGVKAQEGIEY